MAVLETVIVREICLDDSSESETWSNTRHSLIAAALID